MAKPVAEAEKGGGRGAGEAQRLGEGQIEELDAVAHRARHVEGGAGQRAVGRRAAPVRNPDRLPGEAEAGVRTADRRHRIGHQHRRSGAAQCQAQHCRGDMRTIDDQPIKCALLFECRRDRPPFARGERAHRVEQMGEAGQPRGDRGAGLLIARHRMAERDANPGAREAGDKAARHTFGGQRHQSRAAAPPG